MNYLKKLSLVFLVYAWCFTFILTSSCDKKEKNYAPLTPDILENICVPKYATDFNSIKYNYGGCIFYKIKLNFPPSNYLNELNQFYQKKEWIPLNYDLCNVLSKRGKLRGWYYGKENSAIWEQDWVNDTGEAISINITYFNKSDPDSVVINMAYYKPETAKEPLLYYRRIHGEKDEEPSQEVIEKIKKDGYCFFGLRATSTGDSVMEKIKVPYEKIRFTKTGEAVVIEP